jgi:ATP-dependent helicase/nuclease subunit B
VQRLEAVSGERWKDVVARGEDYLDMARELDRPDKVPQPIARPEPRPPKAARPMSLSVTEIETWLRDPYSIYARHILDLRPLEPIDEPPGARDRGTMIHEAIGAFANTYKDNLPDDPVGELIALGETFFAPLKDHPEARAFWWPRFLRIAQWFAGFEAERRANIAKLDVEISGRWEIPTGDRNFTLRTRADRIEQLDDGRFALLDYKTGKASSGPEVQSGLAPQLTLEGAILRKGGFEGIPPGGSIAEFAYVALRGAEPAGELKPVPLKNSTPDAEADKAMRRLTELVLKFEDDAQPYLSRIATKFLRRGGGDYDHLSRIKEWSLAGGPDDDNGDGE